MATPTRPGNYREQAKTYDLTRGASPTIVRAVAEHLGEPRGRTLLDIAGGTGNYAQVFATRGFRVTVVDAQLAMLEHSARKLGGGHAVAGAAAHLPFSDGSFDCATLVHAVHLLQDPSPALREAHRVLREGPLVAVDPTRENAPLFVHEYFGLHPPDDARPSAEDIALLLRRSGFATVEHHPFVYTDTADGSLHALHTNALHLAGPAYLRNTSFWYGLDEEARRAGLDALARDLRSGRLEERVRAHYLEAAVRGHETVFAAWS